MFDTNITPLNISKKNEEKITTFIDLALEFNKTHNIFVRKNAKEVFEKDIVDCLQAINNIFLKNLFGVLSDEYVMCFVKL